MSPVFNRRHLACLAVLSPLLLASTARADKAPPSVAASPHAQQTLLHVPCDDTLIENPFSAWGDNAEYFLNREGDSATAPMVCVGVDTPTMRFFVKNTGAETGTLKVEVTYDDDNWDLQTVTLATLTSADAGDAWTASPVVELSAPLVELLGAGETPVNFKFTAEGADTAWLVDDVYVDPYGKG